MLGVLGQKNRDTNIYLKKNCTFAFELFRKFDQKEKI